MARPPLEIDGDLVKSLAALACTVEDIARVVGCSKDTLERRFMEQIEDGRAECRCSLRRKQWEIAMDGEHKSQGMMCVWLGKNMLGQTDRAAVDPNAPPPVAPIAITDEQLKNLIDMARGKK